MRPVDYILIAVIAAVLVAAVILAVRRKKTSPCCSGNCAECIKKHGVGGCSGNLQGIGKLVEGKNIDEVEKLLAGIRCRGNTSCPDQLSQAITAYKRAKAEKEKNRK